MQSWYIFISVPKYVFTQELDWVTAHNSKVVNKPILYEPSMLFELNIFTYMCWYKSCNCLCQLWLDYGRFYVDELLVSPAYWLYFFGSISSFQQIGVLSQGWGGSLTNMICRLPKLTAKYTLFVPVCPKTMQLQRAPISSWNLPYVCGLNRFQTKIFQAS